MNNRFSIAALTFFSLGMLYYFYSSYLPAIETRLLKAERHGYWSDSYQLWYATHELILHGRNPYTHDVTAEIQEGFYGRRIGRPGDPIDQVAFVYPLYTTILVAPTILVTFPTAQILITILFLLLTTASVALWSVMVGMKVCHRSVAIGALITLGSLPGLSALNLQQPTLLAAALLAAAFASLALGKLRLTGLFMALATFKPQLAALPCLWLIIWTLGDWKQRRPVAITFGFALMTLVLLSELLLPGWFGYWLNAIRAYAGYTSPSLLKFIFRGYYTSIAITLVLIFLLGCWRSRREFLPGRQFSMMTAAALTVTILLVPLGVETIYNQVLLLQPVMLMFQMRHNGEHRMATNLALGFLSLQWLGASFLTIRSLLGSHFEGVYFPRNAAIFFPIVLAAAIFRVMVGTDRAGAKGVVPVEGDR